MNMLPVNRINDIALKVATANLGPANVTSVVASTVISSSSVEALQITIVLARGSASTVTGEIAANTVFDMNKKLQDAGEERFSIIRYSTP
jgi:hypothetical protein